MTFGNGWYEDYEVLNPSVDKRAKIAEQMLKERLAFVFERIAAKHKAIRHSRIANKDD